MEEINECKGCKFYDYKPKNGEELMTMIDTCENCKRAMLPEYQNGYDDLYIRR